MFKTFCGQPAQRNKPKKFDFVHQTVSHWEVRAG